MTRLDLLENLNTTAFAMRNAQRSFYASHDQYERQIALKEAKALELAVDKLLTAIAHYDMPTAGLFQEGGK